MAWLAVVFALLCSCNGGSGPKGGHAGDAPPPGVPVPFDVLVQTTAWTNLPESRRAITTGREWTEFWMECYRPGTGPPQPEVNFATHIVVAAATGPRLTGGYSIAIASLTERNGKLVALVVESTPGPGCTVTQSVTAPATAILVKRHGVIVDLLDHKAVADCP